MICDCATYVSEQRQTGFMTVYTVDPTRTLTLRNAFGADMTRRYRSLKADIMETIVMDDVFGLNEPQVTAFASPGPKAFQFGTSIQKIEQFMRWLRSRIDAGLLEVAQLPQAGQAIEQAWVNMYVTDSYKRGVQRARYELKRAGYTVPTIEQSGGMQISLSTPFHADRLGVMYTRTFNELKGITAAMDTQISRILAQGLSDGDNPRLLARKLIAVIDGTGAGTLGITDSLGRFIPAQRRAAIMARTEVIRAHHQATIQEYKNWGVEGVVVQAEWKTAGDERVCAVCESFEGMVFTLAEIQNMIPIHPQCRCIALPVSGEKNL